jgi:ABC-type Fe3+ transport system permease subunit
MNRSFLIVLVPAIAVGLGYLLMFHFLGAALEPFRFAVAAILIVGAILLVQWRRRRKVSRGSR